MDFTIKKAIALVAGVGFEDLKNYFIGTEKSDLSRNLYSFTIFGIYYVPISKKSGVYIAPSYVISGRNVFQRFAYHVGWTYQTKH